MEEALAIIARVGVKVTHEWSEGRLADVWRRSARARRGLNGDVTRRTHMQAARLHEYEKPLAIEKSPERHLVPAKSSSGWLLSQ
jgi:hypothetical protein